MAFLETSEGGRVRRFELSAATVVIGRSRECDLVLDGPSVSRKHARIRRRGQELVLEDLGSRRGTHVNGEPLAEPASLQESDVIKICDHLLTFHCGVEPAAGERRWNLRLAESADQTVIMSTLDARSGGSQDQTNPAAKLRAVLEITGSLRKALRVGDLIPKVFDGLFRLFSQAARGCVLLEEDGQEDLVPIGVRSRNDGTDDSVRISQTVVRQALERRQGILSADALADEQFRESQSISGFGIRSIMCAPLIAQDGEPFGVLQLYAEQGGRAFTTDDLEVLVSIAATVAMAIENARFHEQQVAQERLQRELQLARDVQQGFLPRRTPTVAGYSFFSHYDAAYSVGGDYYDYVALPDGRVAIAVADVSGKGMSAALLMARISSDVRFALITAAEPAEAMRQVNLSLAEAEIEGKFITLLLMVLDGREHRLDIANAGHLPPLLRRADGSVAEIGSDAAGLPLNVESDPEYRYRAVTARLEPGDAVLAFTDGVTEARDTADNLYGMERLRRSIARDLPVAGDAAAVGGSVLDDLWTFGKGCAQRDDVTLVVVGRTHGAEQPEGETRRD